MRESNLRTLRVEFGSQLYVNCSLRLDGYSLGVVLHEITLSYALSLAGSIRLDKSCGCLSMNNDEVDLIASNVHRG